MGQDWTLREAADYYRRQGAPGNQQALVSLLREVQGERGGAIARGDLEEIAGCYQIRLSFLEAIVRRFPSLRMETARHNLELCGGINCGKRGARQLAQFVESTYGVKSGGESRRGGFTYHVAGCMHNCGRGPNAKWGGVLYEKADKALLRSLIEGEQGGLP